MKIYALIGPSGTGKSHHAPLVARKLSLSFIIDDGLLIKENKILAGKSAKREPTRMAATRRAVFLDPDHAQAIKEAIHVHQPKNILVLATSPRMAEIICQRLELPAPEEVLNITDVTSEEAIKKALETRKKENRHVIPIPTFAIKKEFPGFLIDPVRSLLQRPGLNNGSEVIERSIVRPCYSSLGNLYIAEPVLEQLVSYIACNYPGVCTAKRILLQSRSGNLKITLELEVELGASLMQSLVGLQEKLRKELELITGFNVKEVNIVGARLHVPAKEIHPTA